MLCLLLRTEGDPAWIAAGSIAGILSSITNQYNGNGLQQGASLTINAMLQTELKNKPVLLWMNGDVNYAR